MMTLNALQLCLTWSMGLIGSLLIGAGGGNALGIVIDGRNAQSWLTVLALFVAGVLFIIRSTVRITRDRNEALGRIEELERRIEQICESHRKMIEDLKRQRDD